MNSRFVRLPDASSWDKRGCHNCSVSVARSIFVTVDYFLNENLLHAVLLKIIGLHKVDEVENRDIFWVDGKF